MPHKRIAWKVHYQLHLVPCEFFFQWGWTMQLEYVMK